MNQPTPGTTAPATATPQSIVPNGQPTAATTGTADTKANDSVVTAQEIVALREKLETLEKRVQDKDEYIGELKSHLSNPQEEEQRKEQLKSIGKDLQEAIRDDEDPSRIAVMVANISLLTQRNHIQQERNFVTAYGKLADDNPAAIEGVPFFDLQLHIHRNNIDIAEIQTPKQVIKLVEEVKRMRVKPVDLEVEKKKWEDDWAKKQGAAGATPRPNTQTVQQTQFKTLKPGSVDALTQSGVQAMLQNSRPRPY